MLNLVFILGLLVTTVTAVPVLMQLRSHPKGLVVCFFTEMWERFSYYGMRGLFIYYLTKQFLYSDGHAGQQYASYTTLIYLAPLIGGLVADRWLGTRRAVIFGGLLLVAGHFGMAFEGKPAQQQLHYHGQTYEFVRQGTDEPKLKVGQALHAVHSDGADGLAIEGLLPDAPLPAVLRAGDYTTSARLVTTWAEPAFFLSVSLIILGVGLLKPNISTLVGQLYEAHDIRRNSGFQLYYFGINLGSFWAAVICGYLGETVGWWAGFGVAGLGMLAGLLVFVLGKPWLMGRGGAPDLAALTARLGPVSREHLIYAGLLLLVPVIYWLVQHNDIVFFVLAGLSVAMLAYVGRSALTQFTPEERRRVGLALTLSVASIVFFTLEELAGSALSLFADRNVDLALVHAPLRFDLLGQTLLFATRDQFAALGAPHGVLWIEAGFTAAQTQTINTGFILIFAPLFAALFAYLARRGKMPHPLRVFAVGIVVTGLGFLVMRWLSPLHDVAFRLPLLVLVLNYMCTTIGEMLVSPFGLSQQTRLAPPAVVSTMMALWFTGTAWAQYLGGIITQKAGALTIAGHVVDPAQSLDRSVTVFAAIGLIVVVFGIATFALSWFRLRQR